MSVSNSSTKGKKESIALAATENAKVWTSVRNKYFAVDASRLDEGFAEGSGGDGSEAASSANESGFVKQI